MIIKAIEKLINFENLSQLESENVMNQIMSGDSTPAQIGAYLIALRMKGETVNEITGSAKAMRSHSLKVTFEHSNDNLIDIVGTGGDGSNSFNISTATAFLVAATGRQVAKHGNRAASSKCGSADVLEAAGVVLELQPDQVAECIEKVGIGFMFAPIFHPAMKHAIIPRQDLKQRTIFNVLGPLTNPA
ncbi:MAG TPA: anthranilate phosphoribosyltransferase, partial [Chloroflexi bacterium]|nr:anthranilate phosphoribosyltransferase [Chloroflexota bacterium]